MVELEIDELKKVNGGFEIGLGTIALISIGVPFFIGMLDGFIRPLPCK